MKSSGSPIGALLFELFGELFELFGELFELFSELFELFGELFELFELFGEPRFPVVPRALPGRAHPAP